MAKKKAGGGVNKSGAVRQYLQEHPEASAKEVVAAVAQQGIAVSEALVYNVKSTSGTGRRKAKKVVKRKVARKAAAGAAVPPRGARSQAIRGYLSRQSDASPKDVVAGLKAEGVEVTEGLVASIKYGKRNKAAGRKKVVRRAAADQTATALTADDLMEAKQLADRLGGIDHARQALQALERLR